jgi:hypothetical protein
MPEIYKILGQVAPADSEENILYSSPAATQTLVTNITVVNRSSSAQTFDVYVYTSVPSVSAGYSSPVLNSLYKNTAISANATEILEPGITLGAQNSIVVKGTANITFSVYGVEIS